ncbi:hypothetical protein VF14_27090 [Nostoc linckia z18]|uniref:Uncharacterized protein n=2 Tax=Nostoc linckia TaxID=92942 RepID=A0A9Q5Z6A7_NOSLI|nr:hypothetical protein [Nostoc linckia]PHK29740.1 hypothetical protein VF12_30635 [Nostoc linckia z15]PHK42194.1 hypothetical protein VF13_30050 [Nostoc linckia z16]PHJ59450.1 hypothetical protein VF02_24900 [Nostoc linckia z1]PHJ62651.1 hypothetical protein VF05_26110 [Nostoc linckia z3]PHJ68803.1 hypothetical protein VF03_24380 [Nostoc linckia z2]
MKVDINNAFTIVSLLFMLVAGIYRLARIEASINARITNVQTNLLTAIDSVKDGLADKLHINDKKLDIHLTEYQGRNEHYTYLMNEFDKKLGHQGNRIKDWIDQIATHLHEKGGFIIRDRRL